MPSKIIKKTLIIIQCKNIHLKELIKESQKTSVHAQDFQIATLAGSSAPLRPSRALYTSHNQQDPSV